MSHLKYTKHQVILLKSSPDFNEKWVHNRIKEDPTILGLGELIVKDEERIQEGAGRLDLLLQDPESNDRYEVEIQLGATDESHIIRTIEYWDNERKRYPRYNHFAVIIAADITSRFLNVISLFNRNIPLIAIQMKAIKIADHVSLLFTTVLDERYFTDEEEEEQKEVTDRNYWFLRGSKDTLQIVDDLFKLIKQINSNLELKYNKFYIGMSDNEKINNFVQFRPKKQFVIIEIKHPRDQVLEDEISQAGLDLMDYDKQWNRQRIRITAKDLPTHAGLLLKLFQQASSLK